MEALLIYLAAGAVAGLASGLFGIGGGLIIVPVLLFAFGLADVDAGVVMHLALGTSLMTIVVTSASSLRAHHRLGGIMWPVFRPLAVGLVIGAVGGAQIAGALPSDVLESIFAVFVLLMAARMAIGGQPPAHRRLPGTPALVGTGGVIGVVSSIVGIGGGSLTVPFLVWCGTEMRKAVGTSAACGFPIAVSGAAGYVIAGWGAPELPAWSTGYVFWPAFAGIAAASVLLAPVGAKLAHRLPQPVLKRIFAAFLVIVGLRLLLA